jgi:hypothetical protein
MVNRVTKRLDNSSSLQTEVVSVGNNALMDWGVRGSEDLQRVCLQLHKVSKKHQSRHNITLKVPTVSPPNLSDLHLRSKKHHGQQTRSVETLLHGKLLQLSEHQFVRGCSSGLWERESNVNRLVRWCRSWPMFNKSFKPCVNGGRRAPLLTGLLLLAAFTTSFCLSEHSVWFGS